MRTSQEDSAQDQRASLSARSTNFLPLSDLPLLVPAEVCEVADDANASDAVRKQHLIDIGFLPGEEVSIVARAWPAGDPLVVRVGSSRFALRVAEAACIQVRLRK